MVLTFLKSCGIHIKSFNQLHKVFDVCLFDGSVIIYRLHPYGHRYVNDIHNSLIQRYITKRRVIIARSGSNYKNQTILEPWCFLSEVELCECIHRLYDKPLLTWFKCICDVLDQQLIATLNRK